MNLSVPFNHWRPREHQLKLWNYLEGGGKRAIAIWHRRAGKDEVCLHHTARSAFERVGNFWHCLPEFEQGRRAIWNAVNPHTGRRRIDEAFPPAVRANTDDHSMFIRLANGSTWQVIGSDRYDATVGSSVIGCTYSEWSLANPAAWAYHRPILEENNGWACFITTPRGHNHAEAMYQHAQAQDGWFAELLTARDTKTLTEEQLAEALAEYVALYGIDVGTAQFNQEYLCSFSAAILGAFYALEMQAVRDEGRICAFEHDPKHAVHTSWDLGVRDDTCIWWFQVIGSQPHILDVYSTSGVGIEHYADILREREHKYGWRTGTCFVPHDAKVLEWGTGRTRVETMRQLYDLDPMLVRDASFLDGVNAVRTTLPLCVFHNRCEQGINALEQYHREWDAEKRAFKASHLHDWTSDYADSFRYLALAWRHMERPPAKEYKPQGWTIPPPPDYAGVKGIRL